MIGDVIVLDEFVEEKFNGNRDEAIKCIADELSSMKYKKTKSQSFCRDLTRYFTEKDRRSAYRYFLSNMRMANKVYSKLSKFNIPKSEVLSHKPRSSAIFRTMGIAGIMTLFFNSYLLYTGKPPFTDLISILSGALITSGVINKIVTIFDYNKVRNYIINENILKNDDETSLNHTINVHALQDLSEDEREEMKGKMR